MIVTRLIGKKVASWTAVAAVVVIAACVSLMAPHAPAADPVTPATPAMTPAVAAPAPLPQQLDAAFTRDIQPVLKQYCFGCHGGGKSKGDITLDTYSSLKAVQGNRKLWRTVLEVLEQKQMPPDNKPQPAEAQAKQLLMWVEQAVNQYDCTGPRDPGRVTLRRLNRAEYNNTVRDLLGVDFRPAADFPSDDTGYGFDNIADVLSMSTLLAEKYLTAADDVLEKALTPYTPPKLKTAKYVGTDFKTEVGNAQDGTAWNFETNGQITRRHEFPAEAEYEVRIRAYQEPFGDEPAKMTVRVNGKDVKTFDVAALKGDKKNIYSIRQNFPLGNQKIGLVYINNAVDKKNADPKKRGDRNLVVERMEIEGPFNPKAPPENLAIKRVLFIKPGEVGGDGKTVSEDDAARQILYRFGTRAFRRPLQRDEWDRLFKLYKTTRAGGEGFEGALRMPLGAILVSPYFLFRIEPDPAGPSGTIRPLTDYELAARLSYFLWSSMPDDALLDLAAHGKLKDPATLDAQVGRMLKDPKAADFIRNFVGQWLELRNLDAHQADPNAFPNFDSALRQSMKRETEVFFEHLIKEDHSILDLLSGDYTYVNKRLAEHYGMKGVNAGEDEFVKVSLAGTHRSGVMTQASILTLTAMAARTSPVKRGVFVLEQILGTPPPPPPANVPALPDKPRDSAAAPLRERLAAHRADPVCASCHMRMDGIGFALENFDAVGLWREKEGRFPVDSTGELIGGRKISGPEGLRDLLMSRKADFLRCLTEKLVTYALGRGIEEYDRCTIREIIASAEKNEYRFSALVSAIVKSDAFQKRRSKRGDET